MRLLRLIILSLLLALFLYWATTQRAGFTPTTWPAASWPGNSGKLELTEAAAPPQLDPEEEENIRVYKQNIPSVVNITSKAVAFDFFYGLVPQEGQGSGVIIDKTGYILTNYHVIADARQLEVTLSNRRKYTARVVGVDKAHDLAVIQISAPNLTSATLGDSKGLQVGQKVFAIGNPFGLAGTMTRGIVSSIRSVQEPEGNVIDEAIQTDAAINPGNSGGPLLNSRGEVIGINTMIASNVGQSAGIGFAVPINTAKAVLNDLVTIGRVRRPELGIRGLPIGPELAQQMGLAADYGVLIQQTLPRSAAAQAGLRGGNERAYLGNVPIMVGGDLIIAIDGQQIEDNRDLAQVMNKHRAGDTVTVTVYRGKRKMDVKVVLGEAREQAQAAPPSISLPRAPASAQSPLM